MKRSTETGVVIPPPPEYATAHDKRAAGFARDLGEEEGGEPAKVIGEVTASRLAGLVDINDEERDEFLTNLPAAEDLMIRASSEDRTRAGGIFGSKNLQVNLPGLSELGYSPDLQRKIMREYIRFHLLSEFARPAKRGDYGGVEKDHLFTILRDLYSKDVSKLDSRGNYTGKFDPNSDARGIRQAVMEQDPELFIDLLVALAAARPEAKLTLKERWQRMFADSGPSITLDKEVGVGIRLTIDDDALPYREGKMDGDVLVAKNRLALAAKQPEVIEELPDEAIESLADAEVEPTQMSSLFMELRTVSKMREDLRSSMKDNLQAVDDFLPEIDKDGRHDSAEFVDNLEKVLFRIRQSLRNVLGSSGDTQMPGDIAGLKISGETIEELQERVLKAKTSWMRLQGKAKAALNIIDNLTRKIVTIKKMREREVAAVAQLKIDSREVMEHLRTIFKGIDREN